MNVPSHPLVPLLTQVRQETWRRFHTGKFNYERDMRNLQKFLKVAEEMGDIGLISEFSLVIGGIEQELGNFRFAEATYDRLLKLLQPLNDHWRIGAILNNLGEIYRWQRCFDQSLTMYQLAFQHLSQTSEGLDIAIVTSNLGLIYLAQQHYDEAENWFRKTLEKTHEDSRTFIIPLVQTYIGLADLYLQQSHLEQAIAHIKLAEEWATGEGLGVYHMEICLLYAQIAHQQTGLLEEMPPYYYALAHKALPLLERKYMTARILLQEALYYQQIKETETAKRLALEALQIFVQFEMDAYIRITEQLLQSM